MTSLAEIDACPFHVVRVAEEGVEEVGMVGELLERRLDPVEGEGEAPLDSEGIVRNHFFGDSLPAWRGR